MLYAVDSTASVTTYSYRAGYLTRVRSVIFFFECCVVLAFVWLFCPLLLFRRVAVTLRGQERYHVAVLVS